MRTTGPIVAAVDFSEESSAVASHASAMAEQAKLPLLLVHVIDSDVLRHRTMAAGRSPDRAVLISQARTRLESMVSGLGGYVRLDLQVKCGKPAEEIHSVLESSGASLLVIGANDLTKKRLGSVASTCLRTAPCDVLVLRDWQGIAFSRILVCTDFSQASGRALEQAVSWAGVYGAKLDVVYVMYPPTYDLWGELLESRPEDEEHESYPQRSRKIVRTQMARFVESYGKGLSLVDHSTTILESVSPSLALRYHAADTGADLAALGSQPHSRLAALFSTSTAEYLLHETVVSVLAVRGGS